METNIPRMLMSPSTSEFALIPKASTSTFSIPGVTKTGSLGPSMMSLTPRLSRDSSTRTAFCSYQEMLNDRGRPLTSVSKACARALAITTRE